MTFRKLGESDLYRDHRMSISLASFESPQGDQFQREVVHLPGAVCVVPLIESAGPNGAEARTIPMVRMVRQYRSAIECELLEIPAGRRDVKGEPLETTARRELLEEAGMTAEQVTPLVNYYSSPGFCDEQVFIYLARGLKDVGRRPEGIEEHHMTMADVKLSDVPGLILNGTIVDAKSVIGLMMAREQVDNA